MAKNLYHGSLKDMGPVTLTIKTGPTKSKFSKPGAPKPDYCVLTIKGEDFSYLIDSEQVAHFIATHKGQTLAVVAEGSREESTLVAVGAPASQLPNAPQNQPPQHRGPTPGPAPAPYPAQVHDSNPPGRPGGSPAPHADADLATQIKKFVARNRVLAVIALEAAWHTKREFETAKIWEMPNDTFTAVYTSMLYGAANNGFTAASVGIPLDMKFKVESRARATQA